MSAWTQYLTVLERPMCYFSFLCIHLPENMVVGPSGEDWVIPKVCSWQCWESFISTHLFSIKWILGPRTGSHLETEQGCWPFSIIWGSFPQPPDHLFLTYLLYKIGIVLGGCLSILPPRILCPSNHFQNSLQARPLCYCSDLETDYNNSAHLTVLY